MARPALLLLLLTCVSAEVLTPPIFNLVLGKKVTATATCGDEGLELYCKLVGANADHDEHVRKGQVCDYCDAENEQKKHPPEYAVDGMETWWQSPPLSRGMKYNEVNLTIDLGQEFHVAYVFVQMGISPRPGLWALEKSTDYGKTFKPWQYFSDSPQDCERYFGRESLQPITKDDSVICSTEYSQIVPLEGGEIPISLLTYRPSAYNYFNSSVLQEWTRATNVRLRLLRTKNLLGHLMSVARQDPTVTRRYFYSIKDISIGGRCMCNGHADTCDPAAPESETNILVCRCQHNTCGPQCAQCCPGFQQKKWRISQTWDRFSCEPCNCHNHTTECTYESRVDEKRLSLDIFGRYEGGGVCKNCQHNTEGINCNKCKPTYYRPSGKRWNDIDVCQPCNCDLHYSTGNCQEESGRCECRKEFNPPNCDSCAYGYFDYPNCKPCTCNLNGTEGEHCTPTDGMCPCKYNYDGKSCEICRDNYYSPECKDCKCNLVGSVSGVCDKQTGNCTCKSKYAGRTCNECANGYFEYPACKQCNCDSSGTQASVCDDVTGQCICKEGFGGARCDQCISGYFMEIRGRERLCVPCQCAPSGSSSTGCSAAGKCNCLLNFGGKQCDQCSPGYYKYPDCLPCLCDVSGAMGSTCDDNGLCHCRPNFDGPKCDRCKEQFYNFPVCEECNCDPRGVIASFAGCGSVPAGELCQCKDRVQGRICNDCRPLFWNLQEYNPLGCEECNCHLEGTLGGLGACDTRSGQCTCKMHVGERQCDQCRDGFYRLQNDNVFGCTECDCDVGGAIDNNCDKLTGQCRCHSRVEGRRCDRPIRAHYFPTLHQFQYEVEEGLTHSGPVRYRNSDEAFPGYSWKGYVVFSVLQNEVINVVHILKSSLYRMVVRYANPLPDPVSATITVTPDSVGDTQQTFSVYLRPTLQPQLITVAGEKGIAPSPFVMNPGNWTVTIKTTREIMIDYFVLIPEAYSEATVLTKQVDRPCVVGDRALCRQFAYPSLAERPHADRTSLVTPADVFIDNREQLKELGAGPGDIPLLSADQSLQYNMKIDPSGPYVLLVEYVTPIDSQGSEEEQDSNSTSAFAPRGSVTVKFQSGDTPAAVALVSLSACPYTAPCRQAVVDDLANVYVVNVRAPNNVVDLDADANTRAGIVSIVAVPEAEWHLHYLTPRPYCLRRNGKCDPAVFNAAIDSKKVEIESGTGGDRETRPPILDNSTMVVYLASQSEPIRLESKVPQPGEYKFVVHYYQPDHPVSSVAVTLATEGQQVEAAMPVDHCPSNSGCRTLLRLQDGTDRFYVTDNFTLTFKGDSSKGVWMDYVLVIPAADFTDSALREANLLDYTREFIDKCAANHYYIATNETGFCRDAVFSITAEYNSGTLGCFCDVEGSTDLECEPFGGQCRCRAHVVGRTCSACRTGHYGFPDCRPCHCTSPAAICDDEGRCICPKNVIGKNCDRCKPLTFNFDDLRGCDDCNCNPLGVRDNQLKCEEVGGNCYCKENVIGRACDRCVPGHYDFPRCARCFCDLNGTTDDVCDQDTAQCYCKKHVRGQACDMCKEEYFNLQEYNPDGCTKCYCFGKTTRCTSSYLYWHVIDGMKDWYLANVEVNRTLNIFPYSITPTLLNETVIGADIGDTGAQAKIVYFGAPDYYLGKRLTAYGGYLSYTIFYTTRLDGHAVAAPDVILGGANGFIVHNSIEQPPALTDWTHNVKVTEEDFVNVDGTAVTRDQFMNILANLTSLYIRATYEAEGVTTRLMSVSLDLAVEDYVEGARQATSVEHCQCPSAYRGYSCEQCAEGHYRLSSGPHAGFCVPCQCNSHSNQCDVNTGICGECDYNTMGDHCEQCIPGYHGDATAGTPRDCLICACPMPYASNNFAIGCDLSENGSLISCDCQPGYGGARCEYCAAGYYGDPENIGDYCKPCNCSGNIVVEDPGSCDSITGSCLKCVNNTAGAACNLCAPGFFGDAIFSKNCTACICDEFGMDHCDSSTGTCVCRPNVIGEKCDRCRENHYGLKNASGCAPCNCGLAAESTQCDDDGQCRCRKGVTGKQCDRCAAGYWNYTREGCDHCNCNTGYSVGFTCDDYGQCRCLPGVVGEKCDRCPERWVLIPQEGCEPCTSCTDALLFTVQDMSERLINETQDFKDKADSFFTTQRLNYISNQTKALRPKVQLLHTLNDTEAAVAVRTLETTAKNLLRSAEFAATDSDKQISRASDLARASDDILGAVRSHSSQAKAVVAHVADLATGLELSQQPKVDSALQEAERIKSDIEAKDLSPREEQAVSALNNATSQIERMNVFVTPVNQQAEKYETLVNATLELKEKLNDMLEYIDLSKQKADEAETLNANNRASKFGTKVNSVTNLSSAAMMDLIDAARDFANGSLFNVVTGGVVKNSSKALVDSNNVNREMEDRLAEWTRQLPDLQNITNVALGHARSLRNRADSLRALAERENNNTRTQHAYSAASAYSSIVQEIGDGKRAADEARAAIDNATLTNEALKERVLPAYERSSELAQRATRALTTVEGQLRPNLTRAEVALEGARALLSSADGDDHAIRLSLPSPGQFSLENATQKADTVNATVRSTQETMSRLSADLSAGKEAAQTLPKQADDAQKLIANLDNLLNGLNEIDPTLAKYRAVKLLQEDLENKRQEADERLGKLRDLIEQARTVANRIPFGVSFDRRTTLQPRLPDSIDEMSTSTRVSAYFRTREPNGLILYLGNPKGTNLRRTKSDDFMVVGVQNGYPYLTMDIGDSAVSGREPARIGSEKFVADNRWYQVIVDRVGRNVKFSIRESLDNNTEETHAKEAVLPGDNTIFNLDRQRSKLYVGGAPSDANLQAVDFPAFEGQVEELMIGDTPVGLWNFVTAENLKGARQREKLISSQSGPQEYRFNGRAHVTMAGRRYLERQKNQVQLYFRTYAPDGLIYLVGEGAHFFSIQMQDGRVFLQVSLGNVDDLVIIGTSRTYNDGKWHKIDAGRFRTKCQLKVDSETLQAESSSATPDITQVDTMNFGGNNKGILQIRNQGFDGCLRQISIEGVNLDLTEYTESIGVAYGCQFASLVSLSGDNSFLRFVDITTENLQLTLKFKTSQPDGLIFVYVSRTQTTGAPSISLSLVKGRLVLISQREQLDTGGSTYNDSQWHVVSVTHNSHLLRLVVDDYDSFRTDTAPEPLHILDGVLFIGGLQPSYVVSGKMAARAPFAGCIADATVNGRVLNLLDPHSNHSVTFGRCGATTTTGGPAPGSNIWSPFREGEDVLPTPATHVPDESVERPGPGPGPGRGDIEERPAEAPPETTQAPWPTTAHAPVSTRPPPRAEAGCALAYDPAYDVGDPDEGYRFGTRNDSHISYAKLPGRQTEEFDLTIGFRTFDLHGGLMFYAAAEDPTQFLAVYMKNALLHFSFNCGGETGAVISTNTYNDTKWHTATVVRHGGHGKLSVDSDRVGEASVACSGQGMLVAPFYYGGLRDLTEDISKNLQGFYQPFEGCLKGLRMNGQAVTDSQGRVNSLRCSDRVEGGVYFGLSSNAHSNYLKLQENFKVGLEISISMEIKPRNSTGLLLSVHGKRDFMVIELLENEVVANVENGKGPFHASYRLGDKHSLCDGNWHKIHAVKSRHVVSVGVDGHFSDAGLGMTASTDTRSALYIGGHERPISKVRGVRSRRGFTGCIRNIVIRDSPVPVPLTAAGRNTHVGVCPAD